MAEIVLIRIDHRLIHGQVVGMWIQEFKADHILVIDDILAKDPFMQRIYTAAAPVTAKVEMMTVEQTDVPQAMIIGAYLQMVYIGVVSGLGGVATVDKPLATAITIPIAIATGMSPELAMAIALPFGIIGANISHLEKIIFTYFVHKADKFAEEANTGAIVRCSTIYRFVPR